MSLELGALVEPMSVAYHAAKLAGVGAGDTAMVFGAGPIGIGIWFALRGLGVEDITVVEPAEVRRDAIAALGASDVIDPRGTDPSEHIMGRTDGRGADAAFDAAGVQPAVEAALRCLGAHRGLVAVAIYEEPFPVSLDTAMWESIDADPGSYLGTGKGEAMKQYAEGIPLGRVSRRPRTSPPSSPTSRVPTRTT